MIHLLLGCADPGEVRGELVSALSGAAVGPVTVRALAVGEPDADCAERTATSEDDGGFAIMGLCPRERYRIVATSPWWVPEPPLLVGRDATDGLTLRVWPVPDEGGVFRAEGRDVSRLVSQTAVDVVSGASGQPSRRVPAEIPTDLPRVTGAARLVLVGDAVRLYPLERVEGLVVGPPDAPVALGAWFALGAPLDPPGLLVEGAPYLPAPAGRAPPTDEPLRARFVGALDVPAGDYALAEADGRRAVLVHIGGAG